jgi:hypothetical protein
MTPSRALSKLINSHHHGSSKLSIDRAAIPHLLRCMQARGQSLNLRHILSHMEHMHSDDEDLSILRDRLAEADTIATTAGGGYTQVALATPLPLCSDDFPIVVENSYSDDNVKSLLDRLGSNTHVTPFSYIQNGRFSSTLRIHAKLESALPHPGHRTI